MKKLKVNPNTCKGTPQIKFLDRCYWFYNGECIKDDKDICPQNLIPIKNDTSR